MIAYRTGSLFEAPKGSILAHACNGQGVWGSGIAVEFKKRFPRSFHEYSAFCATHEELIVPRGRSFLSSERVLCLITSSGYAGSLDPEQTILDATTEALERFGSIYGVCQDPLQIHSNKFNSGLFRVPWEKTEAIIEAFLRDCPSIRWTVWSPEGQ